MSEKYELEVYDNRFELRKDLEEDNIEELADNIAEEYGFEQDFSGDMYHLVKENMEIFYTEDEVKLSVNYDEEPEEWMVKGISKILEGEKAPIDLDYFSEENENGYKVLEELEYSQKLDRDTKERIDGVAVRGNPRL